MAASNFATSTGFVHLVVSVREQSFSLLQLVIDADIYAVPGRSTDCVPESSSDTRNHVATRIVRFNENRNAASTKPSLDFVHLRRWNGA
jgi:hypothetical protein